MIPAISGAFVVILLSLCEESPARPSDSSLTEDFWMLKHHIGAWGAAHCKNVGNHEQKTRSAPQTCISDPWSRTNLREVRQSSLLRRNFHWCASGTSGPSKLSPDMWNYLKICNQLVNHMRLNMSESHGITVSQSFQNDYLFDWSHEMLPQLCLLLPHLGLERNLTELRQTVLQWRSRSAIRELLCQMAAGLPGTFTAVSFVMSYHVIWIVNWYSI